MQFLLFLSTRGQNIIAQDTLTTKIALLFPGQKLHWNKTVSDLSCCLYSTCQIDAINDRMILIDAINKMVPESIDVNLVSIEKLQNKPKLLVMDVDSTLVKEESLDEMAKLLSDKAEAIAKITAQAMEGKIDFERSLLERLALLKEVKEEDFVALSSKLTFQDGLEKLMQWVKQNNLYSACVSGGFNVIVKPLAALQGIDETLAHELEFFNGHFTGKILSRIIDAKAKAIFVNELCQRLRIKNENTICIGDGSNDIEMMKKAGLAVGIKPKNALMPYLDCIFHHTALDVIPVLYGV